MPNHNSFFKALNKTSQCLVESTSTLNQCSPVFNVESVYLIFNYVNRAVQNTNNENDQHIYKIHLKQDNLLLLEIESNIF